MNNTTSDVYKLDIVIQQQGLPLFVAILFFTWSIVKTVKFFQKFYHNNMEPAVLLELVFIANLPGTIGAIIVTRILALANLGWLIYWLCVLVFWLRLSIYGDSCLVILDKFVALYWSAQYNATVTNFKAEIACLISKLICFVWTIISMGSFRQVIITLYCLPNSLCSNKSGTQQIWLPCK